VWKNLFEKGEDKQKRGQVYGEEVPAEKRGKGESHDTISGGKGKKTGGGTINRGNRKGKVFKANLTKGKEEILPVPHEKWGNLGKSGSFGKSRPGGHNKKPSTEGDPRRNPTGLAVSQKG